MQQGSQEEIRKQFELILGRLEQDASMKKFRQEYKNIFLALSQSQERVAGYEGQFRELKESLVQESYGVETAIQQSKNDETLKRKIADQIEGVRALVAGLKERDEKNQGRVQVLKANIEQINTTIKNWQTINNDSEELNEVNAQLVAVRLDHEILLQRVADLRGQNGILESQGKTLREEVDGLLQEQSRVEQQNRETEAEIKSIEANKLQNFAKLEALKKEQQVQTIDLQDLQEQLERVQQETAEAKG